MKKMTYVFIALGVICLLYCAGILISGVYGSWFFLIWGITGTAFLALAWLYQKNIWLRLPGIIQKLMIAAILTGAFLFVIIEALIISKFTSKGLPDLDYLIDLAAQQGYPQAYGLSAPSDTAMQANNMFREFFGVVKDLLYGNMTLR